VVGKKVETPNKAVPPRATPATQAPRVPATSAARSDPPMDVDPTELIPTLPPAGQAAAANAAAANAAPANPTPIALDDMDLEDDSATLMFKRPEPPGPPRRPPPPKAKTTAPPTKALAKPPLPAPTRVDKPLVAKPKAVERPLAPPPKPAAKPPPPMFPASVNESFSPEPKLSERPLFEVTIGSEKPLLATPEAGEISLFAPKAPNMPGSSASQASALASLHLKPGAQGEVSAMPALPMLDFSRDVSGLSRSAHPSGMGTRVIGFARSHAKSLVITGATGLIAATCWMVFQAAAAGSETAAASSAHGAMPGTPTLAVSPATRTAATVELAATALPAVTANTAPVAPPDEPAPSEKNEIAEAPAAPAPAPSADNAGNGAAVAVRPGAAEPEVEAPAATERPERAAPVGTVEAVARPSGSRSSAGSSHPAETNTEIPAAKPAPEPVAAPAPVAPSVGGFDGTADFDQSAALAVLRQAAESAKRCQTPDAPTGGVRVAVTFARSGAVSATQIEGSVAGTPLGDCVVAKFQTLHVPPFRGSVMTVRKTVMF